MSVSMNHNDIKNICCGGADVVKVYAGNEVIYQNDINRLYNYFVFDTSKVEGGAPVTIELADYRAGDTTEWDGITYWGDGSSSSSRTHTYDTDGIYTVKTKWMINNKVDDETYYADDNTKKTLTACHNVNKNITDVAFLFYDCRNLKSVDMSRFRTNNIANMRAMFYLCYELEKLDMSGWNTSKVTCMEDMFSNCLKLTPQVSHFDVSNVTNFIAMFSYCGAIDGGQFKNWRISTTASRVLTAYMFCGATITTNCLDLSGWNVSQVANLIYMFYRCCAYDGIDISNWDIRDNANGTYMFHQQHCNNCDRFSPCDIEKHVKHEGVPSNDWYRYGHNK